MGGVPVRPGRHAVPGGRRPGYQQEPPADEGATNLARGFAELAETVRPVAGDDDLETLTETFWAGWSH